MLDISISLEKEKYLTYKKYICKAHMILCNEIRMTHYTRPLPVNLGELMNLTLNYHSSLLCMALLIKLSVQTLGQQKLPPSLTWWIHRKTKTWNTEQTIAGEKKLGHLNTLEKQGSLLTSQQRRIGREREGVKGSIDCKIIFGSTQFLIDHMLFYNIVLAIFLQLSLFASFSLVSV